MKLLRLPRSKIRLGEPLPWNVRDETTRLLLSRGHIVEDAHLLDALLERGVFVDLEEARAVAHQEKLAEQERASLSALKRPQNMFSLWDQTADALHKLMDKLPQVPVQPSRVAEFAAWLIELVDKDADVALYHMVRQESHHPFYFGYNHAIHTAVLCLLLSRHLHWPAARTMSLVQAALTMNMPILQLQGQMAAQEEPMRESQRALIRPHPQLAAEWLRAAGVSDADWLTAVAQHHERADGSGYPQGLTVVADIAVALRVADVFTAKISPRKLRPALSVQEAAKQLFLEDHGGPLSNAVIKELGLFPPGDVVKLASGEIGVVMRRTDHAKYPIVAAITDTAGRPSVHTAQRDTSQPAYAIVGSVADKSLVAHMPPERVFGYARSAAPPGGPQAEMPAGLNEAPAKSAAP